MYFDLPGMKNRKENQEQRRTTKDEDEKKYKESNFMSKHLIKGLKRDLCEYDTNADCS